MVMRSYTLACLALMGVAVQPRPSSTQVQTGTITGHVTDAPSGRPIVGVRVAVVGMDRGAITGDDGGFVLADVPQGAHRVRANRIGFTPQEQTVVVISGQSVTADFALSTVAVSLSDVVVVGYGTQRRADLTGAVASVSPDQLQKTAVVSLQQALQGSVPGVAVTQGDAAPGGAISVQVRGITSPVGDNQPLYVIDGVPVETGGISKFTVGPSEPSFTTMTTTNPLSTLAPSDIESIDVLKDASATAIYGSRGANGVVIITTKRGQRGQPGLITFTSSTGMSRVVRELDVLNARDYATYVNQAFINAGRAAERPYGGQTGSITPDSVAALYGAGVNWQRDIFRTAATRDLQLAFSGGDGDGSYAVSGNYLDQDGAIRGSGFGRGGVRANLDRKLNSIIRFSSNLAVTRSKGRLVRSSGTEGTTVGGIVRSAVRYSPLPREALDTTRLGSDPRAENPTYFARFGANPVRYTDEVRETETVTRGIGGVRLIAQITPFLSVESSIGGNYERKGIDSYFPRTVAEGRNTDGLAVVSGSEFVSLVNEELLRLGREFGTDHHVDAVAGFTYEWSRSNWNKDQVSKFPDDALGSARLQNGLAWAAPQSGVDVWKLASWLGRVNYGFRDRYLVTATMRSDGSSKFAVNNKWATFGSLGLAWRAKQEPFLRDVAFLDDVKLRGSYGQSGNQAIGPYQSLASVECNTTVLGEQLVSACYLARLANPNLGWETTTQYDLGLDAAAWRNRLAFTADVYRKRTDGLLQSVTLASNTGYGTATFNSGEVINTGVELQADVRILTGDAGGPAWKVSANLARNRNRIVSLGATQQQFADRLGAGGGLEVNPFIQKPGLPIGAIWGYRTDGIFRDTAEVNAYKSVQPDARLGNYRYRDLNGDGQLTDADDKTMIGDVNPRYTWGFTNRFTFGRFDLSAMLQGVVGNTIINSSRLVFLQLNGTNGNIPREYVENAFDSLTNPNGKYPRIDVDRTGSGRFSDVFLEDGGYIRLKNVQLGYELPPSLIRGVRSARLYVNAINLFTITDYTGFDPEVSAFSNTAMRGVDLGSYPQSRLFSVGMTLTF
jgi:TonB-linked SusC/RagA family outer membrane protein